MQFSAIGGDPFSHLCPKRRSKHPFELTTFKSKAYSTDTSLNAASTSFHEPLEHPRPSVQPQRREPNQSGFLILFQIRSVLVYSPGGGDGGFRNESDHQVGRRHRFNLIFVAWVTALSPVPMRVIQHPTIRSNQDSTLPRDLR